MQPLLELRKVTKEFPGVRALDSVDLHVDRREVVGLIGENGAGKSTLVKILAGIHRIDSGSMLFDGSPASFRSPRDAFNHGLTMVFQEQSIIPTLTVAENIFLGREQEFLRFGVIDKRAMNAAAEVELAKVHLDCNPATKCASLDFAARQMVEIAKALSLDGRIDSDIVILLDEPTSVLERQEIDLLFEIIKELKAKASIIFISHRLDEVLQVSDRVYVLRDGAVVHETASTEATITGLHEHMVGRQLDHEYYRENKQRELFGESVLSVRNLTIEGEFRNLSFDLAEGQILGIAGVVGSGRESFARCLGGLLPPSNGEILVDGKPVRLNQPHQAVLAGFGFVPSERKSEGIVTGLSVSENMTLAAGDRFSRFGFIKFEQERTECQRWIDRLRIRTPSTKTPMQSLSGGNQQKVVLSKWQIFGSKVAVLDHPTRGIDVGAKEDVYELIREMADQGVAIILLGDTLEEVIGLSNSILVLKDGEVSAKFQAPVGAKPDQIELISKMV
ncbi:MAG: sugar ABC transporter ATP-binding protein [Albidovulum sp.]|nr:sugar ABC transporter ATP-binding protein [Albidovulum sp.]MDE0305498.1 sugar ABC transporter ATP-binding protein [Albidovulum sp.]MDE0533401.1 sugar ABC transporter ATP-binding protein [Albidovulum sp.]